MNAERLATTPSSTESMLAEARDNAAGEIASPGDWLTGAQRVEVWREARDAATNSLDLARREALSPEAVAGRHQATPLLTAAAVEVVHRVASDPGRLTRSWADQSIGQLGEETYTELVGVTSIVSVLDRFDQIMGLQTRPPPTPHAGSPARVRPDDVGPVGAWVSQSLAKINANVSRALSLVPTTNATWRPLVTSHYSRGPEFFELSWDRGLSRPQVELAAARTTALNECFY